MLPPTGMTTHPTRLTAFLGGMGPFYRNLKIVHAKFIRKTLKPIQGFIHVTLVPVWFAARVLSLDSGAG